MNPILAREIRARWRYPKSFWVLFCLTLSLSILTIILYLQGVSRFTPAMERSSSSISSLSELGLLLFRWITLVEVATWLIISTCIAAPTIAMERERGLLESLWLSQLTSWEQIRGRLLGYSAFAVALQIAVLPLLGISLLFGGVSPGEIAVSHLIQLVTVVLGTSIGLVISSRNHRPPGALASSIGFVLVWSLMAYIGNQAVNPRYVTGTDAFENVWQAIYYVLIMFHPVSVAYNWMEPDRLNYLLESREVVAVFLIGAFLVTGANLLFARRFSSHPLPLLSFIGRNPVVEKLRARHLARQESRELREQQASLKDKAGGALLTDLPLHLLIRFKNPLIQREVRSRFRFRRLSFGLSSVRLLAVLVVTGAWLSIVFNVFESNDRGEMLFFITACLLSGGILGTAVMTSPSFTREKESGTWEGIRLSLMPPWPVVTSKWFSAIITFFYYSIPFWILIPVFGPRILAKIGFTGLTAVLLLIVVPIAATAAVGLLVSWRCRNTATATSVMLGAVLLWHVAIPLIWDQVDATYWFSGYSRYSSSYGYYGREDRLMTPLIPTLIEAPSLPLIISKWGELCYTDENSRLSRIDAILMKTLATLTFYGLVTAVALIWTQRLVGRETNQDSGRLRTGALTRLWTLVRLN